MTDEQFRALAAHIDRTPGLAALRERSDVPALLAALNGPHASLTRGFRVSRRSIKKLLLARGRLLAVADPASNASQRNREAAYLLRDPDFTEIDPSDPEAQVLFGDLRTQGLLSVEDVAAVQALGTRPATVAEAVTGAHTLTLTEADAVRLING